jgi:hypothetical protein
LNRFCEEAVSVLNLREQVELISKTIQQETGIAFMGGTFVFSYSENGETKYLTTTVVSGDRFIVRAFEANLPEVEAAVYRAYTQASEWHDTVSK